MKIIITLLLLVIFYSSSHAQDRGVSDTAYQRMLADSSERMLQRYYELNPERKKAADKLKEEDSDTLRQQDVNFENFMIQDVVERKNQLRIIANDPDFNPPELEPVEEVESEVDSIPESIVEEISDKKKKKKKKKGKTAVEIETELMIDTTDLMEPVFEDFSIDASSLEKLVIDTNILEFIESDTLEAISEEELMIEIEKRKEQRKWEELERLKKEKEKEEGKSNNYKETIKSVSESIDSQSPEMQEKFAQRNKDRMYKVAAQDTTHRVFINDSEQTIKGVTDLPVEVRTMGTHLFAAIQNEAVFGQNAVKVVYSKVELAELRKEQGKDTLPDEQFTKIVNHYRYNIKTQCDRVRYAGTHLGFNWQEIHLVGMSHEQKDNTAKITLELFYEGEYYYINVEGIDIFKDKWLLSKEGKITFAGSENQQKEAKSIMETVFYSIQNNSYQSIKEQNLMSLADFKALAKKTGKKKLVDKDFVKVRNQYFKELIAIVQEYHRIGLFEEINWATTKISEMDFIIEGKKKVAKGILKFRFEDEKGHSYRVHLKDLALINGEMKIGNKIAVIDLTPQVLLARKMLESLQHYDSTSLFIRNVPIFVELEYLMQTAGSHIMPGENDGNLIQKRLDLIIDLQQQMSALIKFGEEYGVVWEDIRLDERSIGARTTFINDRLTLMYLSYYLKYKDFVIEVNVENCIILNGVGKIISDISFRKL